MRDARQDRRGRRGGGCWFGFSTRSAYTVLAAFLLAISTVSATKPEPGLFAASGVFVVSWADSDSGVVSDAPPHYRLITDEGDSIDLLVDPGLAARQGGATALHMQRVSVSGIRTRVRNAAVRVEAIQLERAARVPLAAQRWGVLLCRFTGGTEKAVASPAGIERLLGSDDSGTAHLFRTASGGALDLSGGEVFGWFDLGRPLADYLRDPYRPADPRNFDLQRAADDCAGAADARVFFPDFDGVIFAFDREIGGYSHSGAAILNRDGITRPYRAAWLSPWGYGSEASLAHAVGHAFGLPHSSAPEQAPEEGGWGAMKRGGLCAADISDMSDMKCLADDLIAYHEDLMGWIPANARFAAPVGTGGRVVLAPSGDARLGHGSHRVAIIPLPGPANEFYTVEARRSGGDHGHGELAGGVLIHRVDTSRADRQAQVVQPHGTRSAGKQARLWAAGETFSDSDNGILIAIGSESDGRFEVTIARIPTVASCGGGPMSMAHGARAPRDDARLDAEPTATRLRARPAGGGEPEVRPVAGQTLFFEVDWLVRGSSGGPIPVRMILDGEEFCACSVAVPDGDPVQVRSSCARGWRATEGRHSLRWIVGDATIADGTSIGMGIETNAFDETFLVAPPNNDCSSPTVITTVNYTETIDTTSATSPGPDPAPACGNGSSGRSVWYRYTAPGAGALTVDTIGSDYDTILSTWSGACGSLTAVSGGCNDDIDPNIAESSVTLSVGAGLTYVFMVSAFNNDGGSLTFNLSFASPPTNDTCQTAKELSASASASAFTVSAGGLDGPTPPCGNSSKAKSVWYRFTAGGPGTLSVDTLGSAYNTILSAWTGPCTGLSAVAGACNDDSDGGQQSRLTIPVSGVQTYYFMVTASVGDGGALLTNLVFGPSAGTVPDGTTGPAPLVATLAGGGDITLSWSRSCMELESDYAIYEGAVGNFASHAALLCGTAGSTSATLTPSSGDRYYLVVPKTGSFEGSYGLRSDGSERPAAAAACLPQSVSGSCAPACAHDKCVSGAALSTACDPVVSELCTLDPYCCATTWDSVCVSEVRTLAKNLTCPESLGTCSHILCSTGTALVSGCDAAKVSPSCTAAICAATPSCCTTAWDAACVARVNSVCGYDCN